MDALLVAPPEARYVRAFSTSEYLGLAYVASYLESHGYDVEIHNCNCRTASSIRQAVRRAVEEQPPVVGISVPTLPNLPGAVHTVRELRSSGYRGHITMGGHVPTFQHAELIAGISGLSSVVRGEGEQTFTELVDKCLNNADWTQIDGIAYKQNGRVVTTPARSLISDLDSLPFPRRALGNVAEKRATRIAEVASSRGCYGNCTFCSIFSFYDLGQGPRFRCRSPENVVEELSQLIEEYGIRSVIFVDDNFLGSGRRGKQRAALIAQLILERGLDLAFNISCRANDIDPEVFALLKRAGLSRVFVGIESGVKSALERYSKHVSVQQNLNALATLNDLNIKWDMGFMIYDPDTTFEELKTNVRFLRENRLYRFKASTLLLNGMVVFPGTPVEEHLKEEGRLERRTSAALEFMGAADGAADYERSLTFVNQTYSLLDPGAARMREMIDLAYELLTPVYDAIWPLVTDWEKWLDTAVHVTQVNSTRILAALGEESQSYEALLHWQRQIGVLVMNLLEEMVEHVEQDRTLEDFQKVFKRSLAMYLDRGHPEGFTVAVKRAEEFLNRPSISLTLDGKTSVLAGATAVQWDQAESPETGFSYLCAEAATSASNLKERRTLP